jgi:hypothetical protein
LLTEQRRYNATGTMTYYHRYTNTAGLLTADSLFEPDGAGGFASTQALIFTNNADSTVAKEVEWRKTTGVWYCISTTVMGYSQGRLVSATKYETDGISKVLMDSLAYTNDSYGNRTKEISFDNTRTKVYDIVFTWLDNGVKAAIVRPAPALPATRIAYRNGRIEFGSPSTGTVSLYGMDGRRVFKGQMHDETYIALPPGFCAGIYVVAVCGNVNHSQSITIHN